MSRTMEMLAGKQTRGPASLGDGLAGAAPALSFIQPWLSGGILRFGKRIENRVGWRACKYRGPIWLHASATKGRAFSDCADGLDRVLIDAGRRRDRDALLEGPDPLLRTSGGYYKPGSIPMGAIVGRASIVDVIAGPDDFDRWANEGRDVSKGVATERRAQRAWWFGGFALVLDNVVEIEPVLAKGALGLWTVPEQIAADARAALREAEARRG